MLSATEKKAGIAISPLLQAIVAGAACAVLPIAAYLLLGLLCPQDNSAWIAPGFALPGAAADAAVCTAMAGIGVSMALTYRQRGKWSATLSPFLIACPLLMIASRTCLSYAEAPFAAFVTAAAALLSCSVAIRSARPISLAAALCTLPMLFITGYAAALMYSLAMLNP